MGKKPAPAMKAPKEPPQKKQKDAATAAAAKAAPKAAAKQQVIADDCTPDEMKASIQRMLAFCKYRADAKKNKSGQGLAEAQEVLEASGLNEFFDFPCTEPVHVEPSGLSQDWGLRQKGLHPGLSEVWPQGPEVDGLLHQEGHLIRE